MDERLIFIDLNTEMTTDSEGMPLWIEKAARRLERYENEVLAAGTRLIPLTQVPLDVVSATGHPFRGRSGIDSDGEGALTLGIPTGVSQR